MVVESDGKKDGGRKNLPVLSWTTYLGKRGSGHNRLSVYLRDIPAVHSIERPQTGQIPIQLVEYNVSQKIWLSYNNIVSVQGTSFYTLISYRYCAF